MPRIGAVTAAVRMPPVTAIPFAALLSLLLGCPTPRQLARYQPLLQPLTTVAVIAIVSTYKNGASLRCAG